MVRDSARVAIAMNYHDSGQAGEMHWLLREPPSP